MAGLLQQGMQSQQPPPQDAPKGAPPMNEAGMRGDPRAQFEPLLKRMLNYLYGEGLTRVEKALGRGDPIENMGKVVGLVMTTVYNTLRQNGKTVDPPVMVRAGMDLSKAVGEMAMEMGVIPKGRDDAIEMALMLGLRQFGQTANKLPPEEKQHYARIIRGLKEGKQAAQGGKSEPQSQRPPQQPQQQPQRPQQPMQGGM